VRTVTATADTYDTRLGLRLPAAGPEKSTSTKQQEQHEYQNDQLGIVHDFPPTVIRPADDAKLNDPASLKHLNDQHDERDDQQEVYQVTRNTEPQAQGPHDEQDQQDGPQHKSPRYGKSEWFLRHEFGGRFRCLSAAIDRARKMSGGGDRLRRTSF
jgi:hypothetical protein